MMKKSIVIASALIVLFIGSCNNRQTVAPPPAITEDMAYEGVSNYCHSEYDWSIAKDNPSIMNVEMGEETDSEYHVVFRSYTGAFIHFMSIRQVVIQEWWRAFHPLMLKKQAPLICLIT